jgi:prepilin-type N-terminal cleavage/methylation domain-containing protein
MPCKSKKSHYGFTIVELMITLTIGTILALVVGVLLISGQRAWSQTYDSAHRKIKQDALVVTLAFGSVGRRANRLNYTIYNVTGGTFTPAVPQTSNPQEVVFGDAVEFRYWDVELDVGDPHGLMDVKKTATAYALFYLDGNRLKVDYGPCPPGAVPTGGGARNTNNVTTTVLAENVTAGSGDGAFSHTTINGVGQGSVRINVVLTDPENGQSINVMTATLPRNIWPR